ncbi:TPA: hypothetical protein ACGQUH_000719 [Serratia liquefaciens]
MLDRCTTGNTSNSPAASEIHAVWPHSRYLPAKTRAAIDILLAQMPSQLPGN